VPVSMGLERARRRNAGAAHSADPDRFETERGEFFERVRAAYLARAAAEPRRIALIDAARGAGEVGTQIIAALQSRSWIS
jgi:dTMP kinase